MAELFKQPLLNDSSLKAYYRMNAGALTTDSKGSFTLTNTNSVADGIGKYGGGGDCGLTAGHNKDFTIASNLGLTNAGDRTEAFWLKLNTEISSGVYEIFGHFMQDGTNQGLINFLAYEYNGGTRRIYAGTFNGSSSSVYYNVTLGTTWHFFVRKVVSGVIHMYLDGVDVGNVAQQAANQNYTPALYLMNNSALNSGCPGIIDEVMFFNRALTNAEVLTLYREQSSAWFMFM